MAFSHGCSVTSNRGRNVLRIGGVEGGCARQQQQGCHPAHSAGSPQAPCHPSPRAQRPPATPLRLVVHGTLNPPGNRATFTATQRPLTLTLFRAGTGPDTGTSGAAGRSRSTARSRVPTFSSHSAAGTRQVAHLQVLPLKRSSEVLAKLHKRQSAPLAFFLNQVRKLMPARLCTPKQQDCPH